MRYFLGWVVVTAMLTGCGKQVQLGDFKPYVDSFPSAAQIEGAAVTVDNLIVEFGTIEPIFGEDTVGVCRFWEFPTPRITLDRGYWDRSNEAARTVLIYHELGHCLLGRTHNLDNFVGDDGNTYPKSLMNPKLLPDQEFSRHEINYLKELFHPDDPNINYRSTVDPIPATPSPSPTPTPSSSPA